MASTSNHDVLGLDNRLNRFIKEVQDSNSANTSQYTDADKIRLKTYTGAFIQYIDWVIDQPTLDLPESFPRSYDFDQLNPAKQLENEMVNDVVNMFTNLQTEVRNSQSATASNNYLMHDVLRWKAVITKINNYIDNYADAVTPLDLPESSPQNPGVTPGQGGTHQS